MEEGKSFGFNALKPLPSDRTEYDDYDYQVATQLLGLENIVMFCISDCGRNVVIGVGEGSSKMLSVVPVRCCSCSRKDAPTGLEFVLPAAVEANNSQTLAAIKDMWDIAEHVFKVLDGTEEYESIQVGSTGPAVAVRDVLGCCEVLSGGEALEGLYESLKELCPSETVEFYSVVDGTLDVAVKGFLCDGSPMDGLREMSEEERTGESSCPLHDPMFY